MGDVSVGVSAGVRLVRSIGVGIGLAVSALTVVGLPLAVVVGAWDITYQALGGQFPHFPLPEQLESFGDSPLLSWWGMSLPAPASWSWVLTQTFTWPLYLAGILALFHLFLPMSRRIRNSAGLTAVRAGRSSEIQQFVCSLQRRSRGPAASVWVIPGEGIQAFALSGLLRGHAIVISAGTLTTLPRPMLEWVLAHEYGHILHGDTRSASLWILAMRSIRFFDGLRRQIYNLVLRAITEIPTLRLLALPCFALLYALNMVGRFGRWLGTSIFLLFDRWAARRMEFAADRYAALAVGVEPGVHLFRHLTGHFEPRFNGLLQRTRAIQIGRSDLHI